MKHADNERVSQRSTLFRAENGTLCLALKRVYAFSYPRFSYLYPVKNSPTKIVSLLPAATEIVCALGLGGSLVGRSHECDFPAEISHLPVCSAANFPDNLSSSAIDNKVKEILADALSIYTINRGLIKQLAPDVVITQAQCEVCAVSLKEVEAALAEHLDKGAQIISLQPNTLDDIFKGISTVAKALGAMEAGNSLLEELQERVGIVRHKLKYIENKPTVACIEWMAPLMTSGNWVPEMVTIAGGTPLMAAAAKHSAYVEWEALRQQDPDILLVMPCGFPIERTIKELNLLMELPGFRELKAVKNNQFYLTDGNQYFNRPGPRIVDSIEILAEIIHPKQFIFGYEGQGWIKFTV